MSRIVIHTQRLADRPIAHAPGRTIQRHKAWVTVDGVTQSGTASESSSEDVAVRNACFAFCRGLIVDAPREAHA